MIYILVLCNIYLQLSWMSSEINLDGGQVSYQYIEKKNHKSKYTRHFKIKYIKSIYLSKFLIHCNEQTVRRYNCNPAINIWSTEGFDAEVI